MEIAENPLIRCNFIKNLCRKVSDIHTEVIQHEDLVPKCEICSQNPNEFSFIKNQLFLIVKINFHLKDERNPIDNESDNKSMDDAFEVDQYEIVEPVKHEMDFIEDSSEISTNFVAVEDYLGNSEYAEDFCEGDRSSRKELTKPEIDNITNKLYQCALCQLKVSKKCHLVLHMKKHLKHGTNPRRTKRTKAKDNAIKYEEANQQKCPFCQRMYKKRHECRLMEPKAANVYTCNFCPETFSTYPKIYLHHRTHHPDKPRPLSPFQCDVCGTFALRLSALRRHMKTHTGCTPFICDVCQKGFQTRPQLIEHQRKHIPKSERDDKYKCDICQKKFTFRQSLKKHKLLQHTDNRKFFPCNICGGKFISETSLQKHQTTHDGKAPRAHKCDECGRIFEKLKYFNQHRKIQHNIFTDLMLNTKPKKK